MPFGTITATESTFGSISGSIVGAVPGTLSGSVGVPGPQGEQGIQGIQGPPGPAGPGSTWGGIAGTLSAQTDLQTALDGKYSTSNPSGFITSAALSGYAPLASPLFTGDPRGPTAALGDNDTSLATTAFVQQELLSGTANARNLEVYVRNQTGSTIPAASIVYINGATGNRPTITRAQANNDANSAQTFGFTKAAIANNGFGFVIVRGELENVDTSALTEGVQLYLSPTVAGAYTTTKPSAPQHLVYVGICVRAHPTQGVILVAVQNGYELPELHDVKITSPTNGQVLKYDSAQSLWVNGTDSAGVAWGGITGTLTSQTDLSTALNGKLDLSGGVLTVNSTIQASTATTSSLFAGDVFGVELSANPSENASLQYNGLLVQNAVGTMSVTPSGLTFPNASTQTVAYPGSSGFLLKADNLTGLADTAVSRTNLGLGTMAVATAADYSTTTVANGLYYPLSGNPSSFLVAADITGKANLASPALTGNVTIVSNSTGAALFIEQAGTGNILTLHDQATDTNFVTIDANGKVSTIPSDATNGAGFNVAHGVAPTTPVNGDIWTTTSGLFARINAGTQQLMSLGNTQTVSGSITFSNANLTLGNSTAAGTIGIGTGATISGATRTINIGTASAAGSTNNINIGGGSGTNTVTLGGSIALTGPIAAAVNNISLGTGTAASVYAFGTGATATGLTKAVTIGTGGLAGSTTTIAIGSTTGTSTTTLQGTTNGITAAADTNSVALATTAYVVGQASAVAPSNDAATAAVGTSLRYARADHVHLNPLPAGGSANQVLAKVDATSYNTQWVTPSGGGSSTDYQAYTTAGTFTWTKPAGAKWVEILMFGGGGGGGSGTRQATATARSGGGGGGAGAYAYLRIAASSLGATQSVVVGAGGTAGTAITVDATVGNAGGTGGESSFFGVRAVGGGGGGGGTTGTGSTGAGRASFNHGQSTAISSTSGGSGVAGAGQTGLAIAGTSPNFPATGGGGGGGAAAASTTSATGGTGGQKTGTTATQSGYITTISGGTGGTTAGVSPTSGVSFLTSGTGSTGSGGGAYITAVAGMAGAVGTAGGGGGGGGAASDNGFASGAGGAGGDGAVFIITYC
jgi:hypothetical protein